MRSTSNFLRYLVLTGVAMVAWAIYSVGFDQHEQVLRGFDDVLNGDYYAAVYSLVPVVAWLVWGGATVRAWGGTGGAIGRSVLWLGIGVGLWAVGSLAWFYYDSCQMWPGFADCGAQPKDPYPSVADVFYLLLMPCAIVVFINLSRLLGLGWRAVIQFVACFVVAALVSGYWGMPSVEILGIAYGHDYFVFDGASTAEVLTGYGYLVADGVLMSAAAVIAWNSSRMAGGMLRRPLVAVAASFALLYVADFLFVWRDSSGDYRTNGDFTEILFAAFTWTATLALYLFAERAARLTR